MEGIAEHSSTGSDEPAFCSKVDTAPSEQTSFDDEDVDLMRLTGHKPVLERNFSLLALLSFSFMVIDSWLGITSAQATGISSGGPVSSAWEVWMPAY